MVRDRRSTRTSWHCNMASVVAVVGVAVVLTAMIFVVLIVVGIVIVLIAIVLIAVVGTEVVDSRDKGCFKHIVGCFVVVIVALTSQLVWNKICYSVVNQRLCLVRSYDTSRLLRKRSASSRPVAIAVTTILYTVESLIKRAGKRQVP